MPSRHAGRRRTNPDSQVVIIGDVTRCRCATCRGAATSTRSCRRTATAKTRYAASIRPVEVASSQVAEEPDTERSALRRGTHLHCTVQWQALSSGAAD